MMEARLPVFVYGTLRPGEKNHPTHLNGRTEQILPATIRGRLFYVADGGYPYLEPGDGVVRGELAYLDLDHYEQTLRRLDELEEYDPNNEEHSVYLRRRVEVTLNGGATVAAWTYYWNWPQIRGELIAGGDWKQRGSGYRV